MSDKCFRLCKKRC